MGDPYRVAKSRIGRILDHVAAEKAPSDEAFPSSTFQLIFPMNCNTTTLKLKAAGILQRRDSRLLFSRGGSSSRGQYMRQAFSGRHDIDTPAATEKHFSRNQDYSTAHKCDKPLFSKKAKAATSTDDESTSKITSSMKQEDGPTFARGVMLERQQQLSWRRQYTPKVHEAGTEWCPAMDIAESGGQFVVTVELPGVVPGDVQVEVDDERLTIMGKRTARQWRMGNNSQTYHQREIIQGPCRIIWPLPNDVNRDGVSAELVDGLLRVTLPKL